MENIKEKRLADHRKHPHKGRKKDRSMKSTTVVNGKNYIVYSDFIDRCTYAEDEEGNKKAIYEGGYVHNDLTVRKCIAWEFGLPTFRRNAVKKAH